MIFTLEVSQGMGTKDSYCLDISCPQHWFKYTPLTWNEPPLTPLPHTVRDTVNLFTLTVWNLQSGAWRCSQRSSI